MAKETAESKLLKLIEATDAKDGTPGAGTTKSSAAAPSGSSAAPAAAKVFNSVQSVGTVAIPPFILNILNFFSRGPQTAQGFGLQQVNQVLIIVIVLIGAFLVKDFMKGIKESQKSISFVVKQMPFESQDVPSISPKDVGEYVSIMSQRNLFRPFEKKVEEAKIIAPVENQMIKDKVANFKLVGISWLNSAETATVMIEDKGSSVTYFKKTGEDLQGVKIDVIYADRVEMSFQGEKVTMNL